MDVLDGLRQLPDESADCVLIDPPYNIGKDFGNNKTKTNINNYLSWASEWIEESTRILRPSGTMFIYGFSEILAHISVELDLEHRWLVWHYTNKTVPSLNFWQRSHESILCAWKDKKSLVFNRDAVREPYTDNFIKGYKGKNRTRPNSGGRFSKEGASSTTYEVNEKGALPRDVLKHSTLAGGAGTKERVFYCKTCNKVYHPSKAKEHKGHNILKHPTQKPFELTKRLLNSCMPEDGTVVIPFIGSGSEAYVAKTLGHSFIGFEINQDYLLLANYFINNKI
jgi:site-specific DNA-methyltransferase (adenine-specific)